MVHFHLKATKCDRFGSPFCPVTAVLKYIKVCGDFSGPIFTDSLHKALTFVKHFRDMLSLQQDQYAGNSFRIGAAITPAMAGVHHWVAGTVQCSFDIFVPPKNIWRHYHQCWSVSRKSKARVNMHNVGWHASTLVETLQVKWHCYNILLGGQSACYCSHPIAWAGIQITGTLISDFHPKHVKASSD